MTSLSVIYKLQARITDIVNNAEELAALTSPARAWLVGEMVHAAGFAQVGMGELIGGKRTKPHAWKFDILMRDVCDALRRVGITPTMNASAERSFAQRLARDVSRAARLQPPGELFKQMQRGARIEKQTVSNPVLIPLPGTSSVNDATKPSD